MQRRTFLVWFGRGIYTACAAVVAAPALRFLGAPLTSGETKGETLTRRIARLDALPVGEPQRLVVVGTRRDGWTRYPDQAIGQVWVTRISPASVAPEQTELTIFNAACPHSGCPIQEAATRKGYKCHCHGAEFLADGSKVADDGSFTNPSPRGMDPLEHRVVQDETGQWWVEIEYKEFEIGLEERIEKA